MPITNPSLYAVVSHRKEPPTHHKTRTELRAERSAEHFDKDSIERSHRLLTRLETRASDYAKLIARLQKRKALAIARACSVEDVILQRMDKAGLVKADGWHVTFTAHTCPVSVEVFDESAIPKEYIHTKEVQTPDKSAIRRAIEAEIPISGARLVQRVTLLRK